MADHDHDKERARRRAHRGDQTPHDVPDHRHRPNLPGLWLMVYMILVLRKFNSLAQGHLPYLAIIVETQEEASILHDVPTRSGPIWSGLLDRGREAVS